MTICEEGLQRYPWWPDWRGECVAILACGPSMKKADLSALRDRIHVIAIKETIDLFPQAEVLYGCDGPWWRHRRDINKFKCVKLCHDITTCNELKLTSRVDIEINSDEILLKKPLTVGSGGNSGFQAVNLAVQFGATGILMIGFDMNDNGGLHYYGRNKWQGANNPMGSNFKRWLRAFENGTGMLKKMDVDVVNASSTSSLTNFRKRTVEEALGDWGL